jgi:NADH-quinone oxidoreductase subunit F
VPAIIRNGAAWFAGLGPEGSGGTAQFSVSGHVERPQNLELPMGIPFGDLLAMCGGVRGGRKLKAVIPGGCSVPVLPADIIMNCTMDYNSLSDAGSSFGTGAVMVMDETTCMVRVLRRIARFYMAESCGQCTPCREGTGWLYRMLSRIVEGRGQEEDLDKLVQIADKIEGHTICALGDAAAWPVQSFLRHFRHEFEFMVRHHGRSIVDDVAAAA